MYAAAREAIERARDGEGPSLIEAITFRFMGHVFGDDDKYMTKEEKQEAMAKDPLPVFRARLLADDIASGDKLAEIEASIVAEVEDAMQYGLAGDFPSPDELRRDVFATEIA
jgi:pyruvate dehydrogenase E1 component alpha subunit